MKFKIHLCLMLLLGLGLVSCEFDNYDEPKSMLEGRLVYNGEPINVSYNDVSFQLWEPGWQKKTPINVAVDQDGSYSTVLFNNTYKLIIQPFQGPFKSKTNDVTKSDTILVEVKGSQTFDIEVLPYYMIRSAQLTGSGNKASATFKVEQIITGLDAKSVEFVGFYTNKTFFVDRSSSNNIASATLNGADITDMNNISLSVDIPAINPAQNYVYGRVGVKIAGVEDMIFSPVQKINL
ncbi:DUF3823 domain-containing protein [Adhaeribacter swui]|uniref:DUF3823 domain-containing protein n=1 Tax=Adhaeribacter swui TaxID=2086471 RepID=A0A7G7GAG1_9BACT|nr:DUF3823 domain-containing protein [Adhaeribacter swui]QNF34145.1 DUF3823 domain-containing protein [Adhaeribacter swui]